jgi:hypothetical protein
MIYEDPEHRFELVLMMWDEKDFASIGAPDKHLTGRFMDWVLGSWFKRGSRDLSDVMRRRLATAILNAPPRSERELCRVAIELARRSTQGRCPLYLSRAFRDHDSIVAYGKHTRRWLPDSLVYRALAEACQAYEKEDYLMTAVHSGHVFKTAQEGHAAILYAWLTPSPARRSDLE